MIRSWLMQQGAGTPEDPNNGPRIWRILGIAGAGDTFSGGKISNLRGWFWTYIARHQSELCQICGGRVGLVWSASHRDYERFTGLKRSPSGEWAGGCFCVHCFDRMAHEKGVVFRWVPIINHEWDEALEDWRHDNQPLTDALLDMR